MRLSSLRKESGHGGDADSIRGIFIAVADNRQTALSLGRILYPEQIFMDGMTNFDMIGNWMLREILSHCYNGKNLY